LPSEVKECQIYQRRRPTFGGAIAAGDKTEPAAPGCSSHCPPTAAVCLNSKLLSGTTSITGVEINPKNFSAEHVKFSYK